MSIIGYITLLPSSASACVRMQLQHVMTKVSGSSLARLSVFFSGPLTMLYYCFPLLPAATEDNI